MKVKAKKVKVEKRSDTQKITTKLLKEIRTKINDRLKPLGDRYDIIFDCGNCTYGDNEATFKLKINVKNEEGDPITKECETLLSLSKIRGFDINGIYEHMGRKVSLEGYNTRAPRYPIILMDLESGTKFRAEDAWFERVVMGEVG